MPFPAALALLLMGGAAYLLLAPSKKPATGGATPQPTPEPSPAPAPTPTITIPPNVIPNVPGVTPANAPTVQVTPAPVPTPAQVTQQLPQVLTDLTKILQGGTTPATQVPTAPAPTAVPVPTVVVVPTPAPVPSPAPTPLQTQEQAPQLDPHGTIALAKDMINAESSSGWKTALQSRIAGWQSSMGLTADGKFGEKSAYKMAQEVGVLPLIRYWPSSTQLKADLQSYRDTLNTMAANIQSTNPAMAAALRSSAGYEQGQAYTGTPKAVPASARLAQATALHGALGT